MLSLILVLLAAGALSAGVVALLLAGRVMQPSRLTDARAKRILSRQSPADLGLAFEPFEVLAADPPATDPVRIDGWWIPCPQPSDRTLLLLHGYASGKVAAIAWAPVLLESGWNVAAIDFRAHGHSGGRFVTGGCRERRDAGSVIDQLTLNRPDQTKHWAIFGASFGASVALATAADRTDITGVIAESPYEGFYQALDVHCQMQGLPGRSLQRLALAWAQWVLRCDFAAADPLPLLASVPCPVLAILPERDPFLPQATRQAFCDAIDRRNAAPHSPAQSSGTADDPTDARRYDAGQDDTPGINARLNDARPDATPPLSRCWCVPLADHMQALAVDPVAYASNVREFLQTVAPGN